MEAKPGTHEDDRGAYLPPPWLIKLECEKLRASRPERYAACRKRTDMGEIREYTFAELGLPPSLDVEG